MPSVQTPIFWKPAIELVEEDIISIPLSKEEATLIHNYTEEYFNKEIIDKSPHQWASSKGPGKPNNNETGIRGEWAGTRHINKKANIVDFLAHRPWRMSDFGDVVFKGIDARIFDYKTRTVRATPQNIVETDHFTAQMDSKFLGERFAHLQGFVFCTDNKRTNTIQLVGWMLRDDFFANCMRVDPGEPLPYQGVAYGNGVLVLPYRRLHPMSELLKCKSLNIDEALSVRMRSDYKRGNYHGVDSYIQGLL